MGDNICDNELCNRWWHAFYTMGHLSAWTHQWHYNFNNSIYSSNILVTIVLISSLFCDDHSINFDGQNDFVIIPDNAALDLTNNYTLEAWIFPESFSWLAGIISKYQSSAANGYMLRLTSQAPYTGLGFDEKITSTGVLNANQWYHIAAVNDNGQRLSLIHI